MEWLQKLEIEMALHKADAAYDLGPTKWLSKQLARIAKDAVDEQAVARLARSRIVHIRLPDGRSYLDVLNAFVKDIEPVLRLVERESETQGRYFLDPGSLPDDAPEDQKERLLTKREATQRAHARAALHISLEAIFRAFWPDAPPYADTPRPKNLKVLDRLKRFINERKRWGPLPMFESIVLRQLREAPLKSGWASAKAKGRLGQ